MAMRTAALFSLVLFTVAWGQSNQGVRLADSPLGSHAGRVEVMYNQRWGTICNLGWSPFDAKVICNMLNFTDYVCAVGSSGIGVFGEGTGPVWLSGLSCGFLDETLDDCRGSQPQNNPCSHFRDSSVICQDSSVMPVPVNITQVQTLTRQVTIQWEISQRPPYIQTLLFRLYVRQLGYFNLYTYRTIEDATVFNFTLRGLSRNETYEVEIRTDGEYRWCSKDIVGEASEPVNITTAARAPPSTLPIRLVSSDTINQPHIGRLEVYHNGRWGTVCDDSFGPEEADLACRELNYTEGAICYANGPFPRSGGPIWLDNVDCSLADRFEDCTHPGWGVHNCGHREDIGLICNPGSTDIPTVTGLRVTQLSHQSATIEWDAVLTTSGRYRIRYTRETGISFTSTVYVSYLTTQYTLSRLILGNNYSISVLAEVSFGNYYGGNCYSSGYLFGEYSDQLMVEPRETAPTVSVSRFHITLLNGTSVEATWLLPRSTIGVNGIIRGLKLFIDKVNGTERFINISDTTLRSYIITDLEGFATYTFSMLIYTVADGPRSIHLSLTMPDPSYVPLIAQFGVYGNGLETVTYYTYQTGFDVLCGSYVNDTTIFWQFANGSRIGISNPGFRAGHYANGTAVIQIGTAVPFRRLTVCDGGFYTCIATAPDGRVETRNFTLFIGSSIPAVNQPRLISKGPTWVQIGWESLDCDGGYQIDSYDVEYGVRTFYRLIYTTAARVSSLNYTIRGLSSSTLYYFRVRTVSSVSSITSPSSTLPVTTQVSGPSPPRSVTVTVTSNSEVCARWRPPATYTGVVTLYRLYAEIIDSSADITEAIDLPNGTAVKTFSASVLSGCMELSQTDVIYHFQMSAVSTIQGELVEGTLSPIDARTTIYVPRPGIPQPIDLQGFPTNTSVTLQWRLPGNVQQDDLYFNVSYSGVVDWMSNEEVYISFKEQGQATADNTSLVIYPLTPSTEYAFKVAVVTSEGQGEEAVVVVTTNKEVGDKLAYFQIRILNINDCEKWHNEDTKQKLADIRKFLVSILNVQCTCDITTSHISQGEFSCRSDPTDSVVYRARISGTPTVSASDLATLIHNWVQDGSASIKVGSSRFELDPTCNATLDNIHALDCDRIKQTEKPPEKVSETPTKQMTETPTKQVTETPTKQVTEEIRGSDSEENSNTGHTAGILAVALITGVLQLVVFIILLVIIVLWIKKRKSNSFKAQSDFTQLVDEPAGRDTTEDEKTQKL